MNISTVEKIADAVLYEGYMLYPYRASAVKNQQRFNFGVLYPREYGEAWEMTTECLVHGSASTVEVKVRFLQMETVKDWQEGREREVNIPPSGLSPGNRYYPVHHCRGSISGLVAQATTWNPDSHGGDTPTNTEIQAASVLSEPVRQRFTFEASETIEGDVELRASHVEDDLFRVTLIVRNLASMASANREQVLLRSLVSVHSILHCEGGEFVSLLDPPERFQAAAAGCQNIGGWPVLAGDQEQKDMILAAPIILYDYPQIAPESAGDLCDGTEIDEILALRILTMTDAEKEEVRKGDDRARQILERTEMLPPEHFQKLHGALRGLK
jgi:hydrogenase maturation protease